MFEKARRAHAIALLLLVAVSSLPATAAAAPKRPKLVVVIVVDQMRADYLTRFAGLYTGGFRRFLQRGAVFNDAHQDHAITVTAVGHATISTGSFPSDHGIVSNEWFDRDGKADVYATSDAASPQLGNPSAPGGSPRYLKCSALGDWLKAGSPKSRVYSIAFKDRSCMMMGGLHPDGAYWYDDSSGHFVTSTYYGSSYPAWIDSFNASGLVDAHFATGWTKLLDEDAYYLSTADRIPEEADGEHTTFPYVFDHGAEGDKAAYHKVIWNTPFGDELSIELARRLIATEKLGRGPATDLLWLSCSTADIIGHRFGPLSQEAEDCYLRTDQNLERLFEDLDRTVGPDNYTAVLTADHGVLPLPEELERRGMKAGRVSLDAMHDAYSKAVADVGRECGATGNLLLDVTLEGIYLDPSAAPIPPAELRRRVAERVRAIPFVADAYTADELETTTANRPYIDLYRRSFYAGRSPDVIVRGPENVLLGIGPRGTTHGTPYRYDTHVPIVFYGAGVVTGVHSERVRTVDIAPTLAELMGSKTSKSVDGQSLLRVISVRSAPLSR